MLSPHPAHKLGGGRVQMLVRQPSLSKVVGAEASVPGNPREHSWPDLLRVMEGEDEISPAVTAQGSVRSGFALDLPAEPLQGRQDSPGLRRGPVAHAAWNVMERASDGASS